MSRIDELSGNSLFTELSQEVEESLAGGGVALSAVSASLVPAVSQLNVGQLVSAGTCHAGLAVTGQLGFSVLPVGLV